MADARVSVKIFCSGSTGKAPTVGRMSDSAASLRGPLIVRASISFGLQAWYSLLGSCAPIHRPRLRFS